MTSPAALLVSLRHQSGALCTLWAVAAPHPPHSPPQLSHTQTFRPAWHSLREETEVSEPGGALELEEEKSVPGKSLKDGDESGEISPPSPGEPRPERLAWPGLARCETLREMAVRSKLSRLVEATSQLVEIEQTLLLPLLQQHPLPLHPKVSEARKCSYLGLLVEGQWAALIIACSGSCHANWKS